MKCLSRIFQPLITIPKNAKLKNTEITCKSQKLLLELGLIRPTGPGLFSLLPLARRAADKLESLISRRIEEAGAQRLSLPCLTSSKLWEKTGRIQDIGAELMKFDDRHGHKYLLAPTHEEAVADLLADSGLLSYKQLPLLVYQISNKYRDEHRPKHGLLRSREFSMMDAYGAHAAEESEELYQSVSRGYSKIFQDLELPVHRVKAPSGEMGGTLSHEWQLCADAGEDEIDVCPSCSHASLASEENDCVQCGKEMKRFSSIEVGHTFVLGTKYSDPLGAKYRAADGTKAIVMSCYGIGVTRLLAASLEALSSEKSLRWPRAIAPYSVIVIGPKEGSAEWSHHGLEKIQGLYHTLDSCAGFEDDVVVDDRHELTIGKRLMMADRVGYPFIVVCGKTTVSSGKYEVYQSLPGQESTPELMTLEEITKIHGNGKRERVNRKN